MTDAKSFILQGTLDLMVLKTLEHLGPQHGYVIARRIKQVAQGALLVNPLVNLATIIFVSSAWFGNDGLRLDGVYRTIAGGRSSIRSSRRTQLQAEAENWERISGVIGRVLRPDTDLPQ